MTALWYANINDDWFCQNIETWQNHLTTEERYRYKRYKNVTKRNQFLLARALIKLALRANGKGLNSSYKLEDYRVLRLVDGSSFYVSISHSNEMACVCFSSEDRLLGVDLEYCKTRPFLDIAESNFNHNEFQRLSQSNDLSCDFYRIWTLKEALTKALGEDIYKILRTVDCSPLLDSGDNTLCVSNKRFETVFKQSGLFKLTIVCEMRTNELALTNISFNHDVISELVKQQVESLCLLR